jgi:hypothetical protein
VLEWAEFFETADRVLAQDTIGAARISTAFIGFDPMPRDQRRPMLWETMIFGGALDHRRWRYTSRAAALAGHAEALEQVRSAEALCRDLSLPDDAD